MTDILSALGPVFLLIGLGFALKRLNLVSDSFWAPAERLTFYLFFPALLVANTAGAGTIGAEALPMAAALVIGVLIVAGMVSALRPRLGLDGPGFTSVFQGSFRPNTYVGIGAAYALFGEEGLTLMAIAVVAVVPLVNLLAVLALVRHGAPAGHADDPEALYRTAYNDYLRGSFDLAIRAFRRYAESFPDTELTDNATYWIGECYFSQGKYSQSIRQFDRMLERYPRSDKTASAALKKGYSYLELGRRDEGVSQLQEVARRYPESDEANLARQRLSAIGGV